MIRTILQSFGVVLIVAAMVVASPPAHAQTAPPTCAISVTPGVITVGGTVVLRWQSQGAASANITHVGDVGVNGAMNLLPSSASVTVFTGTFVGPGGTTACSASVQVVTGNATGGTYTPVTNQANPAVYQDVGDYKTAESYWTSVYQGGTYAPSNFTQQPSSGAFTNPPGTVGGAGGGNTSPTDFLVPCGRPPAGTTDWAYYETSTECNICSLGQLGQNIINFLLMVSIPLAAALFAWAGILRFTSATNPASIKKSNSIFFSVFVGFAFAIGGYLIVQTMLNALLNNDFKAGGWDWRSLHCTEDRKRDSVIPDIFNGLFDTRSSGTTAAGGGVGGGVGTGSLSQCLPTNPVCSPESLQSAGFNAQQAAIMSCIAVTENSGSASGCTGNACGTFQIMLTQNQLVGSACGGTLNCPVMCSGGVNSSSCTQCLLASQNAACNAQSALALMQNRTSRGQDPYGDWTCPGCNAKAAGCVQKYQ